MSYPYDHATRDPYPATISTGRTQDQTPPYSQFDGQWFPVPVPSFSRYQTFLNHRYALAPQGLPPYPPSQGPPQQQVNCPAGYLPGANTQQETFRPFMPYPSFYYAGGPMPHVAGAPHASMPPISTLPPLLPGDQPRSLQRYSRLSSTQPGNAENHGTGAGVHRRPQTVGASRINKPKEQKVSTPVTAVENIRLKDLAEDDKKCSICYEELGTFTPDGLVEYPVRLVRCKHIFGLNCLKVWLNDNSTCPMCRYKLPAEMILSIMGSGEQALRFLRQQHLATSVSRHSEFRNDYLRQQGDSGFLST